jgi:GH25 family lysozyme M1 (1,4-beta-N-acetylmuramidase)
MLARDQMHMFQGIIDVYEENDLDLADAWSQGVRAIVHQTGKGLFQIDGKYRQRKEAALSKGFLWGAYFFLSAEDVEAQLSRCLELEPCNDPRILLSVDWEATEKGTISYANLRRFVALFNGRMRPLYSDRYPMLYGGYTIRECEELATGDALLGRCPLWYQQYKPEPSDIPEKTWSAPALWQFDSEKHTNGAPDILPGADWSRYFGTLDQLKAAWPFSG